MALVHYYKTFGNHFNPINQPKHYNEFDLSILGTIFCFLVLIYHIIVSLLNLSLIQTF